MSETPVTTTAPDITHDVFVSYRHHEPEASWVTGRLVPALRVAGLRVFVDVDDFLLGEPVITAMTRGVEHSRYTLAVLTPAYVDSSFTEIESLMAEHLGLESAQNRLIAIMREPVEPRLTMRLRLWLDMTDETQFDAAVKRLVRQVAPGSAPPEGPSP
jgi:hypothetical protein